MTSLQSPRHYARRKDGRVLCARLSCGFVLARLIRPDQSPVHHLYLAPGWYPDDDGIWRLSDHAWQLMRRGGKPRHRRPPPTAPGVLHALPDKAVVGPVIRALPAVVVCKNCDLVQWFDGEHLDCVGAQDEAWVMTLDGATWMVTYTVMATIRKREA